MNGNFYSLNCLSFAEENLDSAIRELSRTLQKGRATREEIASFKEKLSAICQKSKEAKEMLAKIEQVEDLMEIAKNGMAELHQDDEGKLRSK